MYKLFSLFKISNFLALTLFLIINTLFILKYGARQEYMSVYFILIVYTQAVLFILYLKSKYHSRIDLNSNFNLYYLIITALTFSFFIAVNYSIDGNSLNTDRWSALQVTVESVLNGKYPYNIKDHLGNTTSNLPALFYLGLPFYLLGNIGLLQPFVFLLGALFVLKQKITNTEKISILLLFLVSPAYYWEIFAKSDLMSNLLLLLMFIYYWHNIYRENYFKKPILLAFFCAFFVLTRGIVIIPLTLFLFRDFIKTKLRAKLLFIISSLLFLFLISLPIIINLPNIDIIQKYNPFNHQTRYAPKVLQVLVLLLPFILSFKAHNFQKVITYSFLLFTTFMMLTFILNVYEEGFYDNVYGNLFDISYLSMILPFAILILAQKNKKFIMRA